MAGIVVTDRGISSVVGRNSFLSARTVVRNFNKIVDEHRTDHGLWSMKAPREVELRYYRETLEDSLKEPRILLIYDPGFSLRDILSFLGSDPEKKPCHYSDNNWWVSYDGDHWINKRKKPDYYLLRMTGISRDLSWEKQGEIIAASGQKFQRASTRLMINLSAAYFLSRGIYLQENCDHWGPESSLNRVRCASRFNNKGFVLFNWGERSPNKRLGTFVVRKFDF